MAALARPRDRSSTRSVIGNRLSAYEILSELGSGGMGTVYLGQVVEPAAGLEASTRVALKVIHPNLLAQPGFFKRFLREAQIGQDVQHENVVRTYDCDATEVEGSATHFLVMEYVEGQTLRELLEELERVPEELCRHIGREIASGLAAIHVAGAVHRDVKPENVLITREHVVKIMDLGVARLQDESIRLSRAGAFVGSVDYAAPEQFSSDAGEPDGRADLHALGVLLYELGTGQHPYRDENVSKVLRRILEAEPRRAGEVNPQLSPFFEEVVHTLLAKDRDQRFAAAADLAGVLADGEESDWWKERAQALRIETKRPLRRIRIPRETALYGRDDDLACLHAQYEEAKAGEGRVLLLEGEAGIGKTRLVDEFVGRLRQEGEEVSFLFGSYPPGGAATAAGAFSTAYREHFGEEDLQSALAPYFQAAPRLVPAFAALLRGEMTPKDAEALTRDSLQTVFVQATRGLAAECTTIVLIDDLHFAPEDGRALFSSLAMAVPGHRILLVGTLRRGVSRSWIADVERQAHASRRALSRLGPKDLAAILAEAFQSERLADELGWQIAKKSDGNPFFAFEIIRGLREGQFIRRRPDGTWGTTQSIQEIQIPSSVMELIQARLVELSDTERNLLEVGACYGFEFDAEVVGAVLGVPPIPALQHLGRVENRHHLVRSVGEHYAFDHHQVHEVLYQGLNDRLRRRYHAAIAEALEESGRADPVAPEEIDGALSVSLCEHFFEGGQGERALRHLDKALAHLEAGYLNEQAIQLVDRALAAPEGLEPERRLRLLLRKCGRLDLLGRQEAQEETLGVAEVVASELGDKASLADLAKSTGTFLWNTGRFEEARAQHERSLELARELGDPKRAAEAEGDLGIALFRLGRYPDAAEHLQRRLDLARTLGDSDSVAAATVNLGNCLQSQGRSLEARKYYERGLALAKASGNLRWEGAATGNLGHILSDSGQFEEAAAHQERQLEIAREIGSRQMEATATCSLGNVYQEIARYEDAVRCREQSLAGSREIGDRHLEAINLVNLGRTWLVLGRHRRAREALTASLAICRDIGARFPEGFALWDLGNLAADCGDEAGAREFATQALALRREIGHGPGILSSLIQIGEYALRAGDAEGARAALEEALMCAREQHNLYQAAVARILLARLPDGDPADALVALAESEGANTPELRYHLWRATGGTEQIEEAKHLLDHLVENAPADCREPMLAEVRLHREILEAWKSVQGDATRGGP